MHGINIFKTLGNGGHSGKSNHICPSPEQYSVPNEYMQQYWTYNVIILCRLICKCKKKSEGRCVLQSLIYDLFYTSENLLTKKTATMLPFVPRI